VLFLCALRESFAAFALKILFAAKQYFQTTPLRFCLRSKATYHYCYDLLKL